MKIEVAYATPRKQLIIELEMPAGSRIIDAVRESRIQDHFPELQDNPLGAGLGIFGKVVQCPEQQVLKPGDRVEIYRPLENDPRLLRARRARGR